MDGFPLCQSPIAWPKSDKKRKPFTPDCVTRETPTKLSSKKKNSKKSQPSTPSGVFIKWPLPSRSSLETFNRVYNEMINSPSEKGDSKNSSLCSTSTQRMSDGLQSPLLAQKERHQKLQRHSSIVSDKGLHSSPIEKLRRSKSLGTLSPVLVPSSSDDDSLRLPTKTTSRPTTTRRKILPLSDSSSDDDSFSLPPPLHERLASSSSRPSHAKSTTALSQEKENNPRLETHLKKKILFDDSSSSECDLSDLQKRKCDLIKLTAKPIVIEDSSDEEFPHRPLTNFTPQPSNVVPKRSVATEPKSVHSKHIITPLRTQQIPQNKDAGPKGPLNLWLNKEALAESSRFLKSLSDSSPLDPATAHYRNKFSKHKEDLVKELYKTFNRTVFEEKLAPDMSITWNIRLLKTAGYCYMRSHRDQSRTARIELSTKVLDSAERVRDTLLHELCHAAAFVIHGYRDGHGPLFKYWGKKAGVLFPFLPVVARCHTYKINTKYTYRCTKCSATIGRHSRSVDTSRKGCGRCGGRFELLVNGVTQESAKKKTPEFAKFVKDHYKLVKKSNQDLKHAEVMQKLGEMFAVKTKL